MYWNFQIKAFNIFFFQFVLLIYFGHKNEEASAIKSYDSFACPVLEIRNRDWSP